MSLISLSRRELIARIVATGVGGAVLSTFGTAEADAQADERDTLLQQVSWMGSHISDQSEECQEWLNNSQSLREARKQEFDDTLHGEWANNLEFNSSQPLVLMARFQSEVEQCRLGVQLHPWMSIVGYRPEVTLNTYEVASLYPAVKFFEERLIFYRSNRMTFAPFPDTKRLAVSQAHRDGFARLVSLTNEDPNDFEIQYVRYYLMSVATTAERRKPQPVVAHAYSRKAKTKTKLTINYSLVQLQG